MARRRAQVALVGIVLLVVASMAAAQQAPLPVVRLGNWLEVGTICSCMLSVRQISATARCTITTLRTASAIVRQRGTRAVRASMMGTPTLSGLSCALGQSSRYQKSLMMQMLFEHQQVFDGNLIDDRANTSNPGGTDVFGRPASTENPGFHIERYWIDYKFPGTPLRMRVGADLWLQDQAGLVADDDPRFVVFGEFGDFNVMAAAVYQFEAQRLGLQNDNDFMYYTFSGWYDRKPHRFQLDVTYFRDRFLGADTGAAVIVARPALGFQGQKTDSVLLMASWSGMLGPVRAMVQGNLVTGTSQGGTAGLPAGVATGRDYDIFAGGVVVYAEVDLGSGPALYRSHCRFG